MDFDLELIEEQFNKAIDSLLKEAKLKAGDSVVLGGSTSEILGKKIGSSTNTDISYKIVRIFIDRMKRENLNPLIQCCEHLNRALVVERDYANRYDLMPVNVLPVANAGGGFATSAMKKLNDPVVIEYAKRVSAGIDIGDVFIGMHLDKNRVGVVVRSEVKEIGKAHLSMIRTRERLIGGARAKHY